LTCAWAAEPECKSSRECVTAVPISAKSWLRGGTPVDKQTESAIGIEFVTIWAGCAAFPLSGPVEMIKVRPWQRFLWRMGRRRAWPELREGGWDRDGMVRLRF
ncbi:MAG TPA: hypothetical protein VGP12_04205, partial [Nitrosospira sp.]|nr:hypothetical protein [Nitrosospira sp.]